MTVHDFPQQPQPVAHTVERTVTVVTVKNSDPYVAAELLSNGGLPRLAWVVQSGDNTCVVLEEPWPRRGGAA